MDSFNKLRAFKGGGGGGVGGGGGEYDRSWNLILCFLKEDGRERSTFIYQMLFTRSKNIDPDQSHESLKVSTYVIYM